MDRTNAMTIEETAYSLYYGLKILLGHSYTDQDFHHIMNAVRAYEATYLKPYTESLKDDQG